MADLVTETAYDHVWRSRTHLTHRAGQALRVVIVGTLNNALVEFDDGFRCVTSCFGYRRITVPARSAAPGVPAEQGRSARPAEVEI